MIEFIKGDLFKNIDKFDILVHGCNCFCRMGAGFAKQMAIEYPQAVHIDALTMSGDKNKLGTWSLCQVFPSKKEGPLRILNAYTQFTYSRDQDVFEYDAWKIICKKLNHIYPKKIIGMPKIGAGLAGGDWNRIYDIMKKELTDVKVLVFEL